MTETKRYYWIKLKTDCMADDTPLDALLGMPNGSEYVCLYIKLCLMTANKNGRLCNQFGEVLIPYDVEKIAKDMKHFSVDTVRVAMELYRQMGLIYTMEDGVLAISGADEMVGSEGASAKWMRDKRERDNHLEITSESHCDTELRDKILDNKSKDIKDIEKESKQKTPKFIPPTIEEVEAYIKEKGYKLNAERWYAYYSANNWKVGRNKMSDWKQAVVYWATSDKRDQKPKGINDCQTLDELKEYWSKL